MAAPNARSIWATTLTVAGSSLLAAIIVGKHWPTQRPSSPPKEGEDPHGTRDGATTSTISSYVSYVLQIMGHFSLRFCTLAPLEPMEAAPIPHHNDPSSPLYTYPQLVGQTPCIQLVKLSKLLERSIMLKVESAHPAGTGKDRAACHMLDRAEEQGFLPRLCPSLSSTAGSQPHAPPLDQKMAPHTSSPDLVRDSPSAHQNGAVKPGKVEWSQLMSFTDDMLMRAYRSSRTGGVVIEGTSGSTGIALAMQCQGRGHGCLVVMPDDQAAEKQVLLQTLGAVVWVVPTASMSSPHHYVRLAQTAAHRALTVLNRPYAFFTNQFENPANFEIHYQQTGPEVFRQCPHLQAFCMSAGTGGTIAGVGRYLKEATQGQCRVILVDPPGSSLYNKIMFGVAYASQQQEQALRRHRYDTIAEGIGLDRVTHNLTLGLPYIDAAERVTDQEAVDMAHWLLRHEGLFVGSSTAMNVVGAVRTARSLSTGAQVVTMWCDGGQRHVSRFWNRDFCLSRGLQWPPDSENGRLPDCLSSIIETP